MPITDQNKTSFPGLQITLQADTLGQFMDAMADLVVAKLKPSFAAMGMGMKQQEDQPFFDVKGLSVYLKKPEPWIREQARNGTIPCTKVGKTWRFSKKKIDAHFQSRPVMPSSSSSSSSSAPIPFRRH